MPTRANVFQVPGCQAGPYRWDFQDPTDDTGATWMPLGIVERAPEIELQTSHEEIRGDNLGETIQDIINTGGNLYVSLVIQEFKPFADDGTKLSGAWKALFPWWADDGEQPTVGGDGNGLMDAIGQGGLNSIGMTARGTPRTTSPLVWDAGAYGLMATALNNVASTRPFQLLFRRVTVAANTPYVFPMGTTLRNMPIRFQVFPHPVGGDLVNPDTALRFYETVNASPGFTNIAGPV